MIDDSRPCACVTGWPISHSRSPIIHRHWLETHGIDGAYERVATQPGEFPQFAARIGVGGLRGANVTIPHKETAFAACDRWTGAARAVGAVNTLWREDGALWGDNTDAEGFLGNLDAEAPGWRQEVRSALVLGAGGAARAIVYALLSAGLEGFTVINRTDGRARTLAEAFGPRVVAAGWNDIQSRLRRTDLLINTTPLGMTGHAELDLDISRLKAGATVVDIVYVPLQTSLMEQAQRYGFRTVGGLGMLLHQAVPGFERWFGVRPSVTPELRALLEADIRGNLT